MATSITLTTNTASITECTLTTNAASTEYTLASGWRGPAGPPVTVETTIIDGNTNAVSGNAVFDAINALTGAVAPTAPGTHVGQQYRDTVTSIWYRWTGTVWQEDAGASTAADVAFAPAGGIAATDVQAALVELAGDIDLKAPLDSPNFTGPVAATGPVTSSVAGAASTPAYRLTGAVLTGGTGTTNVPHLFIQPSGATAATTWSTSGTAIGVNMATGFTGNFIDLKLAGASTSKFKVTSAGNVSVGGTHAVTGAATFSNDITSAGRVANTKYDILLEAGIDRIGVVSSFVKLTGDAGGHTIATITGGVSGQILRILFVDSLVTITDTLAPTANSINLSAAFTSSANDVLTLIFDGTKWFEVSRSIN